jgi:heme A synthase
VLLLEVSYFGAQVVLRGLSPGWAAVDVGSALLVVALMVTAAVVASMRVKNPQLPDWLSFRGRFAGLVLAMAIVVYIVLVSGILVAGSGSITACLGWPIYNLGLFHADGHDVWNALRWMVSLVGLTLLIAVIVIARRNKRDHPSLSTHSTWLGIIALIEALLQGMLLGFGHQISLLIAYTITAAVFWALVVALLVRAGLEQDNP